ncbi:MAG: glutamate-5-semialdehyde dehydrogenase [Verrucomicrobiales bacterium]|jgi:glutamate-5-semialdehyde dehydrogenase|nr:glutamate-5-semialdehyde dehydrogenase [Verrucomicrobiales bacterium]
MSDLKTQIEALGPAARQAARALAVSGTAEKNRLLLAIADALEKEQETIIAANRQDLEQGKQAGLSAAMLDRLELNPKRIAAMAKGVREVSSLADPLDDADKVLKDWTRPNGLHLQKVRVPIGVIGIIYESRPNVTIDASVLCLKTGNATILRGGKEAIHSNKALVEIVGKAAVSAGFPKDVVSLVPVTDREAIPILCAMDKYIDLIIPRGGHGLVETVVTHARMPVLKHYHGVCHVYVHANANLAMAEKIILNAKCQRPGVCNAMETLLVDKAIAKQFLPLIAKSLREKGVKLFGDQAASEALGEKLEEPVDWVTEYLDLILAVSVVDDLSAAVEHIEKYGSHHTDTIVTNDETVANEFLRRVDSAAVFWNASTRFNDGGEFGFGAEIGISTDKLHARGPMALEELTSYKYVGRGNGQIRG